jgi:hypothetical protein
MASTILYISSLVIKPSLSTSYNLNAPLYFNPQIGKEKEEIWKKNMLILDESRKLKNEKLLL